MLDNQNRFSSLFGKFARIVVRLFCLITLLVSTSTLASAQTGIIRTFSLGADGSLTYQVSSLGSRISCGVRTTYAQWLFSNFVYNDPFGGTHPLNGEMVYTVGGQLGCPRTGPSIDPLVLVGDGYTIDFSATGPLIGAATIQFDPNLINPKYVVVAVTYAPPGSGSSVNYAASTMFGSGTSLSDSFSDAKSLSVTADVGIKAFGAGGGISATASTTFTQEQDSSVSVSINKTTAQSVIVPGPGSSAAGVDHDYDVVWLWLNPIINFTIPPGGNNTLVWRGYLYDTTDIPGMDIYGIQLGYLTGKWPIPSGVAAVLARTWAANQPWPPGQGPGLTSADLLNIAAADPFSDPSYSVTLLTVPLGNTTSSDGRFTITDNQTINFVPPGPGGQPSTQTYTENYSATQTQGQTSKQSFEESFSIQEKFGLIKDILSFTFKQSDTLTFTYQWSQTRTNTTGQSASLSVTGPAFSDNYTGPTDFVVYQDNIFGTFMFYPAH